MRGQVLVKDGEKVTLIERAHVSNCGHYYQARGHDLDGQVMMVYWEVTNYECDDEEDACNWNKFEVV